jgi:hypothetical protein
VGEEVEKEGVDMRSRHAPDRGGHRRTTLIAHRRAEASFAGTLLGSNL